MNTLLSSILWILVILLIIILPIYLYQKKQKNKLKKRSSEFLSVSKKFNLAVDEFDILEHAAVGIDKKRKVLIYSKEPFSESNTIILEIKKSKKCEIINSSRNIAAKSTSLTVIDKIELLIKFNDPEHKDCKIEIFNADNSAQLHYEVQLAEKWKSLINAVIHD